jgi:hypothetical protein
MRRARGKAGFPRGRGPVQFFDYGPWRFNINKALTLAANRDKYQPEMRRPQPDWIGPLIDVDPHHAGDNDSGQPVLFATVVRAGQPWRLLIDGNHRVARALRQQQLISVVTLDVADTLKVLSAPSPMLAEMKRTAAALGLLQETNSR